MRVGVGGPFEGGVGPDRVREVAGRVAETGPDALVLADTIGVAGDLLVQEPQGLPAGPRRLGVALVIAT